MINDSGVCKVSVFKGDGAEDASARLAYTTNFTPWTSKVFSYPEAFDAVIAVESVHGILDAELLRRLEGLAKQGGLIVLALPAPSRSVTASVLVQQGYAVFRYFLRGFILVRVDKVEVLTMPSRLWRVLGFLIKIFHATA
jgi:hypothetical protein